MLRKTSEAGREVRILPPLRRVALEPDDELLLRFGGNGGHVCGVGGAPKEGQSGIRLCSCGQFYAYNGRRWKPMSQLHLWLRREYLCCDMGWLFDQGRGREWHVQPFPSWRRLLLQLEGWDAQRDQSYGWQQR